VGWLGDDRSGFFQRHDDSDAEKPGLMSAVVRWNAFPDRPRRSKEWNANPLNSLTFDGLAKFLRKSPLTLRRAIAYITAIEDGGGAAAGGDAGVN
jgi:hypothetical protein